jgi:zinc protease
MPVIRSLFFESASTRSRLSLMICFSSTNARPSLPVYLIDKPDRAQTQMLIGHPTVAPSTPGQPYFSLGTAAFGGSGFTSRLMQEVREKRGWSYSVGARLDVHREGGLLSMSIQPGVGEATDCLALALQLFGDVARDGITEAELEYARKSLLNGAAFDEDTPERCLRGRLSRAHLGTHREQALAQVLHADGRGVREILKKRYKPKDLVAVVVCTAADLEPQFRAMKGWASVEVIPYDRV